MAHLLYGTVNRQMAQVAAERHRRILQHWVERMLAILEDERLITQAALDLSSRDKGVIFECNFAREVWDDPRISFRVRQLASRSVKVELVDKELQIAGKTLKRTQIHVTF
jgi:hypothetical protein